MATANQFPLDYPAALFSQAEDVPLAAEQKLAEIIPLMLAKRLLDTDAFPRDAWLGAVHKMTLPPNVVEAFRILGLDVPVGSVSLSTLASQLSARVRALSLVYLSARAEGLDLTQGFYVVHTHHVRPEVMFWSSVFDVDLSRGQLLLKGWPVRLRSDGTLGTSRNGFHEYLYPGPNTWLIPAGACPTKKDKIAFYRAVSSHANALRTRVHVEA